MTTKIRKYTPEFKQEAVQLALNSPSVLSAAKDLGMPEATLHTWVQKAKRYGVEVDSSSNKTVNVGVLVAENLELKKRLARLEQEKAILKKAATYFAKELG